MSKALDERVKSEKMKVELITNVSHDLKTPLTSIINYADLLSKETLEPEQANGYVEIIKSKSDRLKHLVEDLFEVSKAESGAISVEKEEICLNELITQSLGEYDDKIKGAGLDIKLNMPEEKIIVTADGSKMWRVISNLLSNIVKYSMRGTRVYIDMKKENGSALVTFKNISNYPLNFDPAEITDRFKRGDEARSSEGSGLGLAIAKSFMNLQNGSLNIMIDGDLFKAEVGITTAEG